jgi:methylglutaconyl-CoA hydratase
VAVTELVRYESSDDGVATVTLNRPEKRNALNPELIAALDGAFTKAENDEGVRVILLNANGKDFCAGADLAHLEKTLDWSHDELVADAMQLGNLFIHMRELPKPIVAAVHGNVLAGGCGLATACDIVLASEGAHFGYPEVHIGFVPAMVMTMLIRNVGEKVAFELVATGRRFGPEEAKGMGLVNRVVDSKDLMDRSRELGVELATKPIEALSADKDLLHKLGDLSFVKGIEVGASMNATVRTSEEAREGFRRFLETRRRSKS